MPLAKVKTVAQQLAVGLALFPLTAADATWTWHVALWVAVRAHGRDRRPLLRRRRPAAGRARRCASGATERPCGRQDPTTFGRRGAPRRREKQTELPQARRMAALRSSAIRDLLAVTQRPGMISLAGGLPAPDSFPVDELREVTDRLLRERPDRAPAVLHHRGRARAAGVGGRAGRRRPVPRRRARAGARDPRLAAGPRPRRQGVPRPRRHRGHRRAGLRRRHPGPVGVRAAVPAGAGRRRRARRGCPRGHARGRASGRGSSTRS